MKNKKMKKILYGVFCGVGYSTSTRVLHGVFCGVGYSTSTPWSILWSRLLDEYSMEYFVE